MIFSFWVQCVVMLILLLAKLLLIILGILGILFVAVRFTTEEAELKALRRGEVPPSSIGKEICHVEKIVYQYHLHRLAGRRQCWCGSCVRTRARIRAKAVRRRLRHTSGRLKFHLHVHCNGLFRRLHRHIARDKTGFDAGVGTDRSSRRHGGRRLRKKTGTEERRVPAKDESRR